MRISTPRLLIIGIDGGEPSVIYRGREEGFFSFYDKLYSRTVLSTIPPVTFPAWTSFLTGTTPDWHGLFDFTVREGYKVRFVGGWLRKKESFMVRLAQSGIKGIIAGVPGIYPIEKIDNLVQISGWETPLSYNIKKGWLFPEELYITIRERFGEEVFRVHEKGDDEFRFTIRKLARFLGSLILRIRKKGKFYRWLLKSYNWDIGFIYFSETDTVSHFLWQFHDLTSPWNLKQYLLPFSPLYSVYKAIEDELVETIALFSPDVILIISDHGFEGSSQKVLHLNRFLSEYGLLSFNKSKTNFLTPSTLRTCIKFLSPKTRSFLFELHNNKLPSLIESYIRFSNIDWKKTYVFSEEISYFPSLWLNLEGRDPQGTVPLKRKEAVIDELKRLLKEELKDPISGEKVVKEVYSREELWNGPYSFLAPDIILELNHDGRFKYNLYHSSPSNNVWEYLDRNYIYSYRKGKILPGVHRREGIILSNDSKLIKDGDSLHIWEVASYILNLYQINEEPLDNYYSTASRSLSKTVSNRLWDLGYIG